MSQHAYNFIVAMVQIVFVGLLGGAAAPILAGKRCSVRRMLVIVTLTCIAAAAFRWPPHR